MGSAALSPWDASSAACASSPRYLRPRCRPPPWRCTDMLTLENLSRRFGTRWAVHGLTATLSAGDVVGFLGPNGAGKTTSIKMIAGLLVPSEGRIVLDGID